MSEGECRRVKHSVLWYELSSAADLVSRVPRVSAQVATGDDE